MSLNIGSVPYTGPKEIEYLFIDGGCLRAAVEDVSLRYAGGQEIVLDYHKLAQDYSKVFYYDALL